MTLQVQGHFRGGECRERLELMLKAKELLNRTLVTYANSSANAYRQLTSKLNAELIQQWWRANEQDIANFTVNTCMILQCNQTLFLFLAAKSLQFSLFFNNMY